MLFCFSSKESEPTASTTIAPEPTGLEVRLVDGSNEWEGRVEVYYNGSWGTVCDDSWDIDDAQVVCRMLGYPGVVEAMSSAAFGQGEGEIILDDVVCQGSESSLAECSHSGYLVDNCGHNEDAGVRCLGEFVPINPFRKKTNEYIFLRGRNLYFIIKLATQNFFIFITNQFH